MAVKHTMYQRKVDVDMLNAVESVLVDVSSVSASSEQRETNKQICKIIRKISIFVFPCRSCTCSVHATQGCLLNHLKFVVYLPVY